MSRPFSGQVGGGFVVHRVTILLSKGPEKKSYFSKRQIQALSSDQETRVPNDLYDKLLNMATSVMQEPSMHGYRHDYTNKSLSVVAIPEN